MTTAEFQIVLDVLSESWLSRSEANAIASEIARRVGKLVPPIEIECKCWEVPDRHWFWDESEQGHLRACHFYVSRDVDVDVEG